MINKKSHITCKGPEGNITSDFRDTQNIKHVRQWSLAFLSGPTILRYHGKILRDTDIIAHLSSKRNLQLSYTLLVDLDGLFERSMWYPDPSTKLPVVTHLKEPPDDLIRDILPRRFPLLSRQHFSFLWY